MYMLVCNEDDELPWRLLDVHGNPIAETIDLELAEVLLRHIEKAAPDAPIQAYDVSVGYTCEQSVTHTAYQVHSTLTKEEIRGRMLDEFYDERLDAASCSPVCIVEASVPNA